MTRHSRPTLLVKKTRNIRLYKTRTLALTTLINQLLVPLHQPLTRLTSQRLAVRRHWQSAQNSAVLFAAEVLQMFRTRSPGMRLKGASHLT